MAHSVSQKALIGQYATGLVSGLTKIASTEGFSSLYAGFIPILCKQVPYAIGKSALSTPVGSADIQVNSRSTSDVPNSSTTR